MFKFLLVAAAFFVAFAAGGYTIGRSVVTSEHYMLATIAKSSSVGLANGELRLELSDSRAAPYWRLDLTNNRPTFENAEAMLRSFEGKSLSAESNLLLTFASGGAATTTIATVYKQILEAKKSGDWRTFIGMVVGGASGYLVGYYAAIYFAQPSDKEIQLALRNPDIVEKVKKYVFLSLLSKHGVNFERTAIEKAVIEKSCSGVKDRKVWIDCVGEAWEKAGYAARQIYRQALLRRAQEALSTDKINLKGDEFLMFVLK